MEVRRMPNSMSELYHHGIKGQEWGDRNGPPYPLDSNASVQAKKKKKSLIRRIQDKKKGKMLRKAKEAKKAEREEKERIITSGDAVTVKQNMNKLSDEELARAVSRVEASDRLYNSAISKVQFYPIDTASSKKATKNGKSFLEKTESTLKTVASVAGSVGTIYGTLNKIGVVGNKKEEKKKTKLDELKEASELVNYAKQIEENAYLTKRMQNGDYSHFKWFDEEAEKKKEKEKGS